MSLLVVAAVIVDMDRVLVTQRPAGRHLAGMWEFPGGKVKDREDPRDALVRELSEELGVDVQVGEVLEVTYHAYDERSVVLVFFEAAFKPSSAPPRPIDVAAVEWRSVERLIDKDFAPADTAVLEKVRARLAGASRQANASSCRS